MKNLALLLTLFSFSFAYANLPHSSAAAGAGGAGAASVEVGDASFMNPANLTHVKDRNFFFSSQKDLYALSLTENSKTSIAPGAISYFTDKEIQMFALSMSDFVAQNLSFGVSITYWQAEFDRQAKRKSTLNANAGFIWTPTEHLGIGFAMENMFDAPDAFKREGRLDPNTRFGINYLIGDWFRWRLDLVTFKNNNWRNWTPETGFETFFGQFFILRVGYSKLPGRGLKEITTAGFGLDLPRFRIDYATKWNADGGKDQRHYVDLVIPF